MVWSVVSSGREEGGIGAVVRMVMGFGGVGMVVGRFVHGGRVYSRGAVALVSWCGGFVEGGRGNSGWKGEFGGGLKRRGRGEGVVRS